MTQQPAGEKNLSRSLEYPLQRWRFVVLAALWFGGFMFWVAWFMEGPLLVPYWGIQQHVSFGSAEFLLSAVNIPGIFITLLAGYGYDRLGPRKAAAICLALITVGFGLRPLTVGSFSATLVLSVIAGLGLPILVAPAAVVAQWSGRQRMNLPLSIMFSSFVLGQASGLLLGARMMKDLGIVWAFATISFALLLALAAWWFLVPEAPREPAGPPPAERAPLWQALREVTRAESSWVLFTVGAVYAGTAVFAGSFLPGLLTSTYKLTPVQGGDSAAIFPGAAFLGMFVIGYLARHSATTREHGLWTGIVQLLCWLAFTVTWLLGIVPFWGALLLLAITGFCYQPCFTFGVNALEHARGIRPETVGVAAGFYFTGVSLGGYVLPTVLAQIVDAVHTVGGFLGPLVLLGAGTALWATALTSRMRVRQKTVVGPEAPASKG